ncbi:MAG: cell division protein FtsZ [Prolixibacteraceae bacterium]|nr:cell division protein FtsZ [Prolixibacteraceae bacterium]
MAGEIMNFDMERATGSIIQVIGVGGGGGNAVNHMHSQGIKDVDFLICNTDAQALYDSPIRVKVQLGASLTEGRGAGNKPEVGKKAALENIEDVKKAIDPNTKMVFITAGMGGGTGTGAAPIIAEACKEMNILTVGIVTIPFRNEGRKRIRQAIQGIHEMEGHVDSLLIINNERIREMYGDFKISQAFAMADNILTTAAKGIAEIITVPGYINVDFADVETVMRKSGVSLMGSACAEGENRAVNAVEQAMDSPLLNNNDIRGAKNILLNITSGEDEVTMDEIGQITEYVQDKAGNGADLIWGNGTDEKLGKKISVTLIVTGYSDSVIPEMNVSRKKEKVYHTLGEEKSEIQKKEPVILNEEELIVKEHTHNEQENQRTIEFEINDPPVDEFDELYGSPAKKEVNENISVKQDFSGLDENEVDELENVPAYRRKKINISLKDKNNKKEQKTSKYFLSKDEENKTILRENNSYLDDNVD